MTRRMLLIPVEGPIESVDAPTLDTMAGLIDADYVERVRVGETWSLAVDETGALRGLDINPRASVLYGTPRHGVPICGPALLGAEAFVGDGIDWVDCDPADAAAFVLRPAPAGADVVMDLHAVAVEEWHQDALDLWEVTLDGFSPSGGPFDAMARQLLQQHAPQRDGGCTAPRCAGKSWPCVPFAIFADLPHPDLPTDGPARTA